MKVGRFREEDVYIYIYISKEQGRKTPRGQDFIVTETFYFFNNTLKISAILL